MGYIGKVKDTAGNTHLVGSTLYGTCSTGASTAAKVVTCSNFTELVEGVTIHVKFEHTNTASNATMNVNSTGAKPLGCAGNTRVGTTVKTSWRDEAVVSFTYDGTSWVMNDYIEDTDTDTKNTAGSTNSASKLYLIGATSQAANPQTYSNSRVYETDGALVADSYSGVGFADNGNGSLSMYGASGAGYVTFNDIEGGNFVIQGADSTKTLIIPASYTLAAACAKGVDTNIDAGSTSTNLPTSQAVAAYVASQAMGAATFQGSLVQSHGSGTVGKWTEAELEASDYVRGWYWVCETAGTYAGNVMEAGDMLFCVSGKDESYSASDFTAIQNNIETLTNTEIDNLWANAVAVS